MAPRRMLPPEDLSARLELPFDASFEAIEIAWRALLKQHHPDVAGPTADALAKRINVAHDWLSDPDLRARYDRERPPRRVAPIGLGGRRAPPGGRSVARGKTVPRQAGPPRPLDASQAIAHHVDPIPPPTNDD